MFHLIGQLIVGLIVGVIARLLIPGHEPIAAGALGWLITALIGMGGALLGTVIGNAIGARTGLELVRIGDFHVVAASLGAQLAMLATDLLAQLGPQRPPAERPARPRGDGDRADR